jgi:hypothetical protein
MQRQSIWLAKLAVLCVSLVLGLCAIEVLLRVTGRDHPLVWRPDPALGWWHIPGSKDHWVSEGDGWVEINNLGIRDATRTVAKPAGVFRIAVFGDSMTEGVQVNLDQTFCQLLEKRLRRETGRDVEVLNFGVNGYGALQEYLLFKEHGRAFKPDLVLHAVFLDNDIADGHPRLASSQRGAPFVVESPTEGLHIDYSAARESTASYDRQPIATIRRMSALYRVLSDARWRRLESAEFAAGQTAGNGVPRRYLVYADQPSADWETSWGRFERVVAAFAADAHRDGAEYALISVPAGQVVNTEAWDDLKSKFSAMSSRQWRLRGPEERLKMIATRHNVPLIEPIETFAQSPRRRSLFFGLTGHLTPEGHQMMAAVLEQQLFSRGLIRLNSSSEALTAVAPSSH